MGSCETLIFDDDMIMGHVTEDILVGMGFSCRHILDSHRAMEQLMEFRPRLVVLDIMMPGMDGLTLCRLIKADPLLREVKVVVISSKNSPTEQKRALKVGADAFLHKPYDVETFRELIARLAGSPQPGSPVSRRTARVQIWGCRGYSKEPLIQSEYGRLTSCVSLRTASGAIIVLDAGSGIARCAYQMSLAATPPTEITLLLTHYHEDHVQGLSALPWAKQEGLTLKVGGPVDPEVGLEHLVSRYLCGGEAPRAKIVPIFLTEGDCQLSEGIKLSVLYANHPSTTLAFAIEVEGRKLVYCPDSGLAEDEMAIGDYGEKLRRFARGAEILIHDAHLAPEEEGRAAEEGHSTWKSALRLGIECGARRLVLFHHNAAYDDQRLRSLESAVQESLASEMTSLKCFMAKDNMPLDL